MTTTTPTSRWEYTGNGVTTSFQYTAVIYQPDQVDVYLDKVKQTLTTHYSVTGVGAAGGGNVVFITPPAQDVKVVLQRKVPATQEATYKPAGPFAAKTTETGLDKTTVLAQQIAEILMRTPVMNTEDYAGESIVVPAAEALKFWRWNATAQALENADANKTHIGAVAPAAALGTDGDIYLDLTAKAVYGPKSSGNWGDPTSFEGPEGPPGPTGNGTGDMLKGNNLSELADKAAARSNLELGTAAQSATTDFAAAAHVGSGGAAHAGVNAGAAGFMSAADKSKLDGIEANADANPDFASQAEAEAGADNDKIMTALRVLQSIIKNAPQGVVGLQKISVSNAADAKFLNVFSNLYDRYTLIVPQFQSHANGAFFRLSFSDDGGSTWIETGGHYKGVGHWASPSDSTISEQNTNGDYYLPFGNQDVDLNSEPGCVMIDFLNPAVAARPTMMISDSLFDVRSGAQVLYRWAHTIAHYEEVRAVDSLRLHMSNSNITVTAYMLGWRIPT